MLHSILHRIGRDFVVYLKKQCGIVFGRFTCPERCEIRIILQKRCEIQINIHIWNLLSVRFIGYPLKNDDGKYTYLIQNRF